MLRTLLRLGLTRGLLGGSRPWMVLGGAAAAARLLGRAARRTPKVVACEELKPGQTLVVSHLPDRR